MEINLKDDKMTKHERWSALLNRKPMDRVPMYASMFGFSTLNAGYSIADFYNNPEKSYEAQMKTADKFRWQDIPFNLMAALGAWEFGGEIRWPKGELEQAPVPLEATIQTHADVEKLKVPDVKTAGLVPYMVEVAKKVDDSESPYVMCFCGGPFTVANNICGAETFLRMTMKKPQLAYRLLDLSTEFLANLAQYWLDLFGPQKVILHQTEPNTTNQLISPRIFKDFAFPYIKKLNEKMLHMGCKHIFLHACAEQNKHLELWSEIPFGDPGLFSIGPEVDLEVASPYFKDHILQGNIDPSIILSGTPEDVYQETKKCIEKGKKHPGGFQLMTGCEMPPMAPEENVWAITQAINDFGWFE